MKSFVWDFSWPIITVVAAYAVYALIVKPKLTEAAIVTSKAGTVAEANGWVAWAWAKIEGWKTVVLTAVAGTFQMIQLVPAEVITEWQQLPWGGVFESAVANKISVVCAFLIAITHAVGIAKAAKATPAAE